jgi:hypothetical protein
MYLELLDSELLTDNMKELLKDINVREVFYEQTRFNEINSYEIAYACLEIAVTQNISFSINNLINAFNVVSPKFRVPVNDYLDDKTIKLINEYKDQTEIYILIELTQAHHYFDYTSSFNPSKKIWLKHKVVSHIIQKFKN